VFLCGCCTPPSVPPETTNTHHYSTLVHISHATATMKIIFISLLPNLFFLTYIPHYYPLTFQLISSPSGHHKFNFDYSLFFLKIKTHFMKGKKTNSTLNMAKFHRFINLAESANRGGSLTSPKFFICIWSSRTPN
jgi:hypothetical protein